MTSPDLPHRLTPSQQSALAHLEQACEHARATGAGRVVFVSGAGETGRSHLVRHVAEHGLGSARTVVTDADEPNLFGLLGLSDEPLVLALDDADQAPSKWWFEFVVPASERLIAGGAVALLVVGHAPPSHVRTIVDRLAAQDLADELTITNLSRSDLTTWLGPMSPMISAALWDLTGGQVAEVHELMAGWVASGSIAQGRDGQWSQRRLFDRTPADFTRLLQARLREQVGSEDVTRATRLLASAAMQGPTFLVEASARAVGVDVDAATDLLDERLSTLVEELPGVRVGEDVLWRYRFLRRLDRRIAAERLLTDRDRREIAARTAAALAELR